MLRGGENGSKFMSCLSKKNYDYKKINKKPSNIGIKVLDVEWQTTGRNIRPAVSNENPEEYNKKGQIIVVKGYGVFKQFSLGEGLKIREFGCRRGYHLPGN